MGNRANTILTLCLLAAGSVGCMTAVAAFQPTMGDVIVLTTTDSDGTRHDRVLSPIEDAGQLFVSANHWPRAWYRRALENPHVQVTRDDATRDFLAVPVSDTERDRLLERRNFPVFVRVLTGFAPREFLRLDPR